MLVRPGRMGSCSCTAAAQHQVFHPVDVVHLGRVDMPIEHDHLHVLGVRRNHLVWIIGFGVAPNPDRANTG